MATVYTTDCEALQDLEWQVLQSIFPEQVSSLKADSERKLECLIELDSPTPLNIVDNTGQQHPESLRLSYLPPVLISLILPTQYPLHCPPCITNIHPAHGWLGQPLLLTLETHLLQMWDGAEEGVLYTWMEFIRSGDVLRTLELAGPGNGSITIRHPSPCGLAALLSEYERKRVLDAFASTSFTCSVCMTSLKGSRCISLACGHVFCREDLEDYWKLCIREGDVGRVGCPDTACVKEHTEASEEDVARVVTAEEVARWKWLREKRLVERDPSIIHCPCCQTAVPRPRDAGDDDSGWSRFRQCSGCGFSFCSFCQRTWHGPLAPCEIIKSTAIIHEYMELPEGSPERIMMERRYGKKNLLRLVGKYEEEKANQECIAASTMACPGCKVHVQKSMGCNHMTCAKCTQHFCYRCGERLPATDPYKHFSTKGISCYNKLFDYEKGEDGEWQPMAGFDF